MVRGGDWLIPVIRNRLHLRFSSARKCRKLYYYPYRKKQVTIGQRRACRRRAACYRTPTHITRMQDPARCEVSVPSLKVPKPQTCSHCDTLDHHTCSLSALTSEHAPVASNKPHISTSSRSLVSALFSKVFVSVCVSVCAVRPRPPSPPQAVRSKHTHACGASSLLQPHRWITRGAAAPSP